MLLFATLINKPKIKLKIKLVKDKNFNKIVFYLRIQSLSYLQ